MNHRIARLVGAAAIVAVLATACGDNSGDTASAAGGSDTTMATHDSATTASDTPAATLRAGLTSLLQEHVYLAGITTGVALQGGDFKIPAAVLDKNSEALAEAIGGVYGDAAGEQFLALWRKHIGFFVDYTTAAATNDAAGKQKALAELDGYRNDFGAFISAANPNLPKEAVAEELKPHIQTLAAAIDAQAAKSPDAYAKLQAAAAHMPMTAAILAGGIVTQFPDKFGS